jgi:phosphate-selective porin
MTSVFAQQEEPELTPVEKLEQKTETLADAVLKLQKFKVSGYVQTQYQWGEKDALLKVGTGNENLEKSFSRFGIRRGRIKFTYEEKIVSGVFELDMTEKGLGLKDAYLNVKNPWIETISLRAGIFDRPFGNEISYSSSKLESPERSTLCQTIFPDEKDLGAMLTLQAAKTSPWNFLKLDAGLFAGNAINRETDSRLDFIGHLSADKSLENNVKIGGGVSYYNGGVFQGTENVYSIVDKEFTLNNHADNKGKFAKREYFGVDAQFSITSILGMSQLRAEYLFGKQPGVLSNSKSPNASTLPTADTYNRHFNGAYVIFVQDLGRLPLSAVLKYDWYDPNTKLSKNEIGINNTSVGDIAQNTFGVGLLWRATNNLRLQAYYEINKNETTENITKYKNDLKDNVFTLRLQYKF